jgi:hypothetical protein
LRWLDHKLHAGIVHNQVVGCYFRIFLGNLAKASQEESVGHLHYVRLVYGGDLFSSFTARIFKRELRDAARGLIGDDLQAFNDARNDLMFEARVQIFGILANHDQVYVLVTAHDTF